jgi:hypothetical protein
VFQPSQLTVVVPAFECSSDLRRHSNHLTELRKAGVKILWAVTPSKDKTEIHAQEICADSGDFFLEAPPGLYQSWNFAIAKVLTKYLYISTINDFPIGAKPLELCKILERWDADLVFSPPHKLDSRGSRNKLVLSWPVYRYLSFLKMFQFVPVPTTSLIAMQVNGGLSCLLGSWASIVTKTEFMRRNPFPINYGHHSDTLWFYNFLLDIKILFYPKPIARFAPWSTHKKNVFSDVELLHQYKRCVTGLFINSKKRGVHLKESFRRFRSFYAVLYILNKKRGPHPKRFWWTNIVFWNLRFRRDWAAHRLAAWHEHWRSMEND